MLREYVYVGSLSKADQLLMTAYLTLIVLEDGRHFVGTTALEVARIELFELTDWSSLELAQTKDLSRIAYVMPRAQPFPPRDNLWYLTKPARLASLREILAGIIERQETTRRLGAKPLDATAETKQLPEHRKLEYWLTLLTSEQLDHQPRELQGLKENAITFVPAQGVVYFQRERGWQTSILEAARCPILLPCIHPILPVGGFSMSYARFRWELCRVLSRGILLPGVASMPTFTLLQWPDFGELGANPDYLKLSALFHARALSIPNAVKLAKLPKDVVVAFINGRAALGLLKNCPQELLGRQIQRIMREPVRPSSSAAAAPKQPDGRFSALIGKLRNVFALGR